MPSGIMVADMSDENNKREAVIALGFFFLITVLMTWPVAARPFWIRIDENFDVGFFWWCLWWIKRSLWDLHTSPFWCDYLMYPQRANVIFQETSYVYGLLSIPAQLLLGVERGISISTNLIIVGSTALSGWGAWLLARRVTGDARAAYIAGCAFAFTPFRFWHMGRFHLICTELVVIYAFAFWVALDTGRRRYALVAGALFATIVYSSPTYVLYAVLMSLFIALRFIINSRQVYKTVIFQSAIAGAVAVLFVIPWFLAVIALIKANPVAAGDSYGEIIKYSGDIVGYFFPGRSQRLLGPLLGRIGDGYPGIGGSEIFLGYVVLAAALIGAFRYAKGGVGFWVLCAICFWVLSLGPFLKIAGHILFPLPYAVLLKLGPIFRLDRDPCRYVMVTTLCLSMAAAFGVRSLAGEGKRRWVYAVVVILVLAEFFQAPLEMRRIVFPDIYYQMRRDGENYAVLELPLESPFPRRYARVYQSMHQKPIIQPNQYSIPDRQRERYHFMEDNRFFSDLRNPAPLIEHPDEEVFMLNRDFLVRSKVKYIIIHEKVTDPVILGLWDDLLRRHRPEEIIEGPGLRAYMF